MRRGLLATLLILTLVWMPWSVVAQVGSESPGFGVYPEVALTLDPFYGVWIGPYITTGFIAFDLLFSEEAVMMRAHSDVLNTTVHVGLLAPISPPSAPYVYPFVGLGYNIGDQLRFGLSMATVGLWWVQIDFVVKGW